MSRGNHQFSSVKTEGGLLPQDILARIQAGDPELEGTKAETYHLGAHERIGEAANQAWSRLVSSWHAFQEALAKEPDNAPATGLTRDRWLLPLFEILGYGRLPKGTAIEVEGKSYAVSHTWHHSPIHLLGCRIDLDTRQKGVAGAAMSSPHGLVQDFLNRSDAYLWGFVTNGYQLRILRDHHSLTRQAYVEFDLQAIMDGEQYSEFLLLWLVCHQSRVEADKPEECWLETWVNISRDEGVRALDKLRDGVEKAIEAFGTGFLAHKANTRLKAALESGELDSQEYYRQILRLVYRLIFLFVAEERDALLDPNATEEARERYRRYYATRRIRDLADKRRGSPHGDLWRGISLVMEKLDDGYPELGLPALGSMLWGGAACPWLMDAECANDHVLTAVRLLSHLQEGKTRYPVNWRNVGADELGSIYESLLERHPRIHNQAATFELETAAGNDRKTTGSYYTPTSLVDCLLDHALDPVLDEAAQEREPEQAILDLKVCDPACGSGHFLVAAARRIAKRLASVRSRDDEPSPRDLQTALRDVVGHCLYGVDLNPMAVELCKVSLWLEAIEPGKPLSFLDSHIQRGNALLGSTPALMSRGVPDDAFKPIAGDDKDVAKRLKKRNREERRGQTTLFGQLVAEPGSNYEAVALKAADIESVADKTIDAVRDKERRWNQLSRAAEFKDAWFRADAWCAAFVWPKEPGDLENGAVTDDLWRRIQPDMTAAPPITRKTVRDLAKEYGFFHWHLAFPQVFGELRSSLDDQDETGWSGGFDAVVGNPPWERVKLQEKEWFAERAPEIASARNAAARRRMISDLADTQPDLLRMFLADRRKSEGESHFLRNSNRFPLTGTGDVNTYAVFTETGRAVVGPRGLSGLVVPTGIATDDQLKKFFADIVSEQSIQVLIGFENEEFLFPSVANVVRFCVAVIAGGERPCIAPKFAFYLRHPNQLQESERFFELTKEEILVLNPNTLTCPIFRSKHDAELTKRIYREMPILYREEAGRASERNPWGVEFLTMFHMANDSGRFLTSDDLRRAGWVQVENSFSKGEETALPLYEAKFFWHFDHRFGSYELRGKVKGKGGRGLPHQLLENYCSPQYTVQPRYWVNAREVDERQPSQWSEEWFLAFRDVTSAKLERTAVFSFLPRAGVSHKAPLIFPEKAPTRKHLLCFVANCNSLVFDYLVRQKIGGTSLSYFVLKQIPVLPPEHYSDQEIDFVVDRVLELTFTSWDLHLLAESIDHSGAPYRWDESRRRTLKAELDAFFALAYGLSRDELNFVLDPADVCGDDFPGETFRVLKEKEVKEFGDYRMKAQVLEIYDRLQKANESGQRFSSLLDPPPADSRAAHPKNTRPEWAKAPA